MSANDTVNVDLTDALPLLQGQIDPEKMPRKTLEFVGNYLNQETVTSDDLNYLRQSSIFDRLISAVEVDMPIGPKAPIGFLKPILQGEFDQKTADYWAEQDPKFDHQLSRFLTNLTSNDGVSMKSLPTHGPIALESLKLHNPVLRVPKASTFVASVG